MATCPFPLLSALLGCCLTAILAFAIHAAEDSSAETDRLMGTWLPVEGELGGQPMPAAILQKITLRLTPGKYDVTLAGQPAHDIGTWATEPATKPKGMKITGVTGPNAGKTFLAIYELKADSLRVCYDLSGARRPPQFKTDPGTLLYLVTYKRKTE